jgi:NADH-quinone oxidoreductase subunit A
VSSQTFVASRFTISYYLTAMLFIVFDIEIVFLYPLALVLDDLGTFALAELGVFVALLAVAYVYIWRKGALEWQ